MIILHEVGGDAIGINEECIFQLRLHSNPNAIATGADLVTKIVFKREEDTKPVIVEQPISVIIHEISKARHDRKD